MVNSPPPQVAPRHFNIKNGLVESSTGQQDADDFAADYRVLEHFANEVGEILGLGKIHSALLQETAFTLAFLQGPEMPHAYGCMIEDAPPLHQINLNP